jgi:cytochrome c oxidase cbb3-type subunit 3
MSTETTRGHSHDGIEEFDNHLPNWWLWSFYLAVIFSIGYWVYFHTIGVGDLPLEAYAVAQSEAAKKLEAQLAANPITDESLRKLASEPAAVEEGRVMFQTATRCAQCHRADGGGNIGPNLTDSMWIYGGKPMDIYTSILKGRPRGMLAHESEGVGFVMKATAYVLSIKDSNVPNGKAAEADAKKEQ